MARAISLALLDERPARSTIVLGRGDAPPVFGPPELDLVCGHCAAVLARAVTPQALGALVFVCPTCESYNTASGIEARAS